MLALQTKWSCLFVVVVVINVVHSSSHQMCRVILGSHFTWWSKLYTRDDRDNVQTQISPLHKCRILRDICQSVTNVVSLNIFWYSFSKLWSIQIYLGICFDSYFSSVYIRVFVRLTFDPPNIFRYSFG